MTKRHTLPTHLQVSEKVLQLPVLGIGITARQFLLLLVGGAACYQLWLSLVPVSTQLDGWGSTLQWLATGLVAALTLALMFGQIEGLSLEQWLPRLLLYWRRPRVCLWRTVRREESDRRGRRLSEDLDQQKLEEQL